MNIMELGAIGELVGGAAVIGSLLFVGMQVRKSNRQESAQADKEAITKFVDAFAEVNSEEAVAENFRAGMDHFDEMTPNQQSVFSSKMQIFSSGYYQVWTLHELMLVDEDVFATSRVLFLQVLRTTGGRQWWNAWKHLPPRPYVTEIEKHLSDPNSNVTPANEDVPWWRYEQATSK